MPLAPFANQRPVDSHGGPLRTNLGPVLHVQVGNNSPFGTFAKKSNKKSSHFWVAKNGNIEQYVDTDTQAWAQADGNSSYCSIETEGYPDEPLTDKQIESVAKILAWGSLHHPWMLEVANTSGRSGLGWHGMGGKAWGNHPGCPGDKRRAQRQAIVDLARSLLGPHLLASMDERRLENVNIRFVDFHQVTLDPEGCGWVHFVGDASKVVNPGVQLGSHPERDHGYWKLCKFARQQTDNEVIVTITEGLPRQVVDFTVVVADQ
jgi:hypothetical protein